MTFCFTLCGCFVKKKKNKTKKKKPKNIKTLAKARATMLLIFIYLCPFPSINVTDKGCLIATVTLQVSFKIIGKI